jgi:WD40 repeat protein
MVSDGYYRIQSYDPRTGQKAGLIQLPDHSGNLVFSQGGKLALVGHQVVDLQTQLPIYKDLKVWNTSDTRNSFIFDDTGHTLITSDTDYRFSPLYGLDYLNATDLRTGKDLWLMHWEGEDRFVLSYVLSPDGGLLAGCSVKNQTLLIDVATGKLAATLGDPDSCTGGLAFSPDGKFLLSADQTTHVYLWDLASRKSVWSAAVLAEKTTHPVFSPDGRWLTFTLPDGGVQVWRIEPSTGRIHAPRIFQIQARRIERVVISPDGSTLAALDVSGEIHIWDLGTGRLVREIYTFSSYPTGLVWTPDGKVIAASEDAGAIQRWDAASGQVIDRIQNIAWNADLLAISPDGKILVTAAARDAGLRGYPLQVLDAHTGNLLRTLDTDGNLNGPIEFSPDSALLVGPNYWGLAVWNLATGQETQIKLDHEGYRGIPFCFSADGRSIFFAAYDPQVIRYDLHSQIREIITVQSTLPLSLEGLRSFDEHTSLILNACRGAPTTVNISYPFEQPLEHVNPPSPQPNNPVPYFDDWPDPMLAYSPASQLIALSTFRQGIRIYNGKTWQFLASIPGAYNQVISFSPDGLRLATVGLSGSLDIWDLSPN